MKSRRHHRSRWAHCNTPEALRRRRAAADAKREQMAHDMPPVNAGLEPMSVWQTVLVLNARGEVEHRITLYVPHQGRCDQHAAEVDGVRQAELMTATGAATLVRGWIRKRPSVDWLAEIWNMA